MSVSSVRLVHEQLSHPKTEIGLANVSDAKRHLLQKYLRGEMDQALTSSRAIARRGPDSPPQLSFAQERLWFLDQMIPGSPVFNVPVTVRLSRAIDVGLLQKSLTEIVRRHEVFRTTFITVDGRPETVITSDLDHELEVVDLAAHAISHR